MGAGPPHCGVLWGSPSASYTLVCAQRKEGNKQERKQNYRAAGALRLNREPAPREHWAQRTHVVPGQNDKLQCIRQTQDDPDAQEKAAWRRGLRGQP